MTTMNEFKERIRAMCKSKEKSEVTEEKMYECWEIIIVEDTIDGNTCICTKEVLKSDKAYTKKISANNVENGEQIVEYRINALPAGRACFGGYTDKECNKDKRIYDFADVWYKIYGKPLKTGRKFTESELIAISQEIKNKLKDAKFTYIYSIKCKDTINAKDKFEGVKYFGGYLEQEQRTEIFEMIDDDDIKIASDNTEQGVTITIGGQKIHTKSSVLSNSIIASQESEFEIILITSIGTSRVYSKARYTREACKQIVKDYEKERTDEER